MNLDPLSPRQRQILRFIADRVEEEGRFPSFREIGDHFALSSPATVKPAPRRAGGEGYLRRAEGHITLHPSLREDRAFPSSAGSRPARRSPPRSTSRADSA